MVGELLILGTASKVIKDAINIEYLKSQHLELSEEEKRDIISDENRSFIHFTTEENARNIMRAGFIIPSKGVIKNHFSTKVNEKGRNKKAEKVYMFDSKKFSIEDYIRNLPKKYSPYSGCYTFNAISMRPNEYSINNFSKRASDGAITYDGRIDLAYTNTRQVKYALDLDENEEYIMKEIALDEEYIPSEELIRKLEKTKVGNIRYNIGLYRKELKKYKEAKDEYKKSKNRYNEQKLRKKELVKANMQLLSEEEQIDRVYQKNGKSMVVRKSGYDIIDGKKLQKVTVIGNGFDDYNKKMDEITKDFYMDDCDFDNYDANDMSDYFYNNYTNSLEDKSDYPKYIGMPLKILENGKIINEYDEKFREHYARSIKAREFSDKNIKNSNNNQNLINRIKSIFSKNNWKRKSLLLSQPKNLELRSFGVNSVEELNRYDDTIEFSKDLKSLTNEPNAVTKSDVDDVNGYKKIEDKEEIQDNNIGIE